MARRLIVYTKDVARMLGKSDRYARIVLSRIRKEVGKSSYEHVTVVEFARFMKMTPEEVYACIDA